MVKEDKFQKTQKAKHAFDSDSLWDFVFLNLLCEFWEECLSSIMCKFCPLGFMNSAALNLRSRTLDVTESVGI